MAAKPANRASPSTWARRTPGFRDFLSIASVGIARILARRTPLTGSGLISAESPVIITGMHRSGTSVVTRLLERAGLYVGGSWVDRNNESIFFKRANMAMTGEGYYKLHDYGWASPKDDEFILARRGYAERATAGVSVFLNERENGAVWGWKDPRNSLTLPVWRSVYPSARVIHVVRDGRAVALSLNDRDGLDLHFGMMLWSHYLTRAERALESIPEASKLTIRFEELVDEPLLTLRRLCDFAGLQPAEGLESIASGLDRQRALTRMSDPRLAALNDELLLSRHGYHSAEPPQTLNPSLPHLQRIA